MHILKYFLAIDSKTQRQIRCRKNVLSIIKVPEKSLSNSVINFTIGSQEKTVLHIITELVGKVFKEILKNLYWHF